MGPSPVTSKQQTAISMHQVKETMLAAEFMQPLMRLTGLASTLEEVECMRLSGLQKASPFGIFNDLRFQTILPAAAQIHHHGQNRWPSFKEVAISRHFFKISQ